MFAAIREYFAKPEEAEPIRGRGRRLAALFAFEFVVVLLGVLAAQLLQDWFASRAEARRASEAIAAFEEEAGRFRSVAEYRLRAHQCESGRLARLAALIRSGGTADEAERAPPIMPMPIVTQWSDDVRAMVSRYEGARTLARYDSLSLLARMISERQRQLENQWADFRLLAPETRSPADRDVLALAAARAEGLLEMIDMNAKNVGQLTPNVTLNEEWLRTVAQMNHPCASAATTPLPRTN